MTAEQKKSLGVFAATFVALAIFVLGAAVNAGIEKNRITQNTKSIDRVERCMREEFKALNHKLDDIGTLLR